MGGCTNGLCEFSTNREKVSSFVILIARNFCRVANLSLCLLLVEMLNCCRGQRRQQQQQPDRRKKKTSQSNIEISAIQKKTKRTQSIVHNQLSVQMHANVVSVEVKRTCTHTHIHHISPDIRLFNTYVFERKRKKNRHFIQCKTPNQIMYSKKSSK